MTDPSVVYHDGRNAETMTRVYAEAVTVADRQRNIDEAAHAEQVERDKAALVSTLGDLLAGLGLNYPGLWDASDTTLDDTLFWSLVVPRGSQTPHVEVMWSVDLMREKPPVVAVQKDGTGQVRHTQYGPPRGPIVVAEPPEIHHCDHPMGSGQARLGDLLDGLDTPEARIRRLALFARQCPCGHWRKPLVY